MKFTIKTSTVPIELENAETGKVENYTLREMTAAERGRFIDGQRANMITNSEGKAIGVRKIEAIHADLLCVCLLDADGKKVPKEVIQDWPAGLVDSLYAEAQKINNLGKAAEDNAVA